MKDKEIERKFLVQSLPELACCDRIRIIQGYAAIAEDGTEVRLRKTGRCTITIKAGRGLARAEWETEITEDQFSALWPATDGRRLEKTRYLVPHNPGPIELDVYEGGLAGLTVAEIEFGSEAAAGAFEPPPWFGTEVTEDARYNNQSLAVDGAPK